MFAKDTLVLVVDDMKMMRKLVCKALSTLGLTNTIEAENGNEAWEKLQASDKKVNLIISDWNMPECTGLELLKKVRSAEELKRTPFVLLTAEREGGQIQEAIASGVDHYIVKPFDQASFQTKLLHVYKKYHPEANQKAGAV